MELKSDTNSYMQLCLNLDGQDPLYLFVPTYHDAARDEWTGFVKLPKSKKMIWGHGKDSKELEQSFNDCLRKSFEGERDQVEEVFQLFKPLSYWDEMKV